jgi:hypothetical protein
VETKARPQTAWWCTPVSPALGRLRQKDQEFQASLGYIARPCLTKQNKTKKQKKKKPDLSWVWWLMLIILATWEAEIGRIKFQGQPREIVHKTYLQK